MLSKCFRGVIVATNKIQTGIRFEPELLYKITQIAKKNKRSLNAQLEYLAQSCVEDYEREHGDILLDENEMYRR
ncbi:MAG: Arc family DNA-binding protein [Clostridia bacterium]|nr:Arc family DNA-binding protein [Clostridia bacterium]